MTNDERWAADLVRRVGRAIKSARAGRSAAWLSERTAELGYRVSPTVIAKLDSGHRGSVLSVVELIVIAAALDVAPVALIYPDLPDGSVERLPGDDGSSAAAVWWFTGEYDEPTGDLGRLLWLTRYRYAKREQALKASELLDRIRQIGGDLSTDDGKLVSDLLDEVNKINELIREVQGSVVDDDA